MDSEWCGESTLVKRLSSMLPGEVTLGWDAENSLAVETRCPEIEAAGEVAFWTPAEGGVPVLVR